MKTNSLNFAGRCHRASGSIPLRLCVLAAVAALLTACGGGGGGDGGPPANSGGNGNGGGGGGGTTSTPTPTSPIVYLATQEDAATPELFLIDSDAAGTSTKLNAPLVAGGAVQAFAVGPNGDQAAYIATQDSVTEAELYLVDLDTPGVSTKLSRALPANGAVSTFEFSPDGGMIAYVADADSPGRPELYLVDLTSIGAGVKLNDALQVGGAVRGHFMFSPDSSLVLYSADRDIDESYGLFLVDVDTPGAPELVNPPLVAGGSVDEEYRFSPDGATIVYQADQDTNDTLELYAVQTAAPGTAAKLNQTLPTGGDLCNFVIDPTSQRVAYCAEQDTDGVIELYVVELSTPGISNKLNPPLVSGGRVTSYAFGPNGDFLVYRADQDTDDMFEIYSVEIATPAASTKLNGPIVAGGDVALPLIAHRPNFLISPDGTRVVYSADQDTDQQFDLYSVERAAAGAPVKLTPPLTARGTEQFDVTDDGTVVVYQALQGSGFAALYSVEIAAPGTSLELSDDLVSTGVVSDFAISPGLRLLE